MNDNNRPNINTLLRTPARSIAELSATGTHHTTHFGERMARKDQVNKAALNMAEIVSHFDHMVNKEDAGWRMEYSEGRSIAEVTLYHGERPYIRLRDYVSDGPDREHATDINLTLQIKQEVKTLMERCGADSPEYVMYLRLSIIVSRWVETHRTHVYMHETKLTAEGRHNLVEYRGPLDQIYVEWWEYHERIEHARMFCDDVNEVLSVVNGNAKLEFPTPRQLTVTAFKKVWDDKAEAERAELFSLRLVGYRQDYDASVPTEPLDFERWKTTWVESMDDSNRNFGGDPGVKMITHACFAQLDRLGYKPVSIRYMRGGIGLISTVFVNHEDRVILMHNHLYVV